MKGAGRREKERSRKKERRAERESKMRGGKVIDGKERREDERGEGDER